MLESSLEAPLPSSCFSSLILPEGVGWGGRGSVRRGWQYGRFTPGLRPRVASLERGENLENLTILLQGSTKYVLTAWHETKWGRSSSPAWWGMNTSFHPPTTFVTLCYAFIFIADCRLPRQPRRVSDRVVSSRLLKFYPPPRSSKSSKRILSRSLFRDTRFHQETKRKIKGTRNK